jgi:diacylglycerol kinase (ATP)
MPRRPSLPESTSLRQLCFIVNPAAGPCPRRARNLVDRLRELCPDDEVLVTESPGQARQWAAERRGRADLAVVAVGGDGTVHEVANGLLGGQAKLGVLPLGSGNDFAKMLSSPRDPEQAVAWFREAEHRFCDVGEVTLTGTDDRRERHLFINGLGVGLEAVVANSARNARYLKGFARYLVAALWHLALYKPPRMQIRGHDGDGCRRQFLVAVGNGFCAGGRFRLTPDARIDDGLLDVCRVDTLSRLRLLRILPSVLGGRHARFREVRMSQVEAIEIVCPDGCMVHTDGEVLADDAVEMIVRVLPGALPLLG